MFKEYDVVRLKRQVCEVRQGTVGTIVMIYSEDAREVMVEFPRWNEEDFPVIDVNVDDLELNPSGQNS